MEDWADYSFVKRSIHRKRVFQALSTHKTPTQLANELKLNIGYISNLLISLLDRKLIECLNPKEKRYRIYRRSKKGEKLAKQIKSE